MIANKKRFCGGLAIALLTLAADQLSKHWMLFEFGIADRPPVEITPFFNLVMVWNYGISFGMFSGHNVPVLLSVMALAITLVLLVWLAKATDRLTMVGTGFVIGGAIGNVIDRARFGAVADFFDFHAFGYHWPAFNIADSAIFIGVVVLCIQSMLASSKTGS